MISFSHLKGNTFLCGTQRLKRHFTISPSFNASLKVREITTLRPAEACSFSPFDQCILFSRQDFKQKQT